MKTTIDSADALLREAKDALLREAKHVASQEGVAVRALVEDGLRRVLADRKAKWARRAPFTLRDASFSGKGLQPGIREGDWDQRRDLVHEGRGP